MPLATLLNCSSLIPSRVIHMPIGSENSGLSRRAMPQWVQPPSAGRRPCQMTFGCATLRTTNNLYRRMRIGAAQRKLSRNRGGSVLAPGYACVPRKEWRRRYRDTLLPRGAHVWYKGDDGLWWIGKISASTTEDGVYLAPCLDDPWPIKLAPSFPGALHNLNGGSTRFLVPAGSRSQRVLSGGPTQCR